MTRQRVPALLLGTRAGLPHDDRVPAAGRAAHPGGAVTITWRQYAGRVRRIATRPVSLGVRRGTRWR
jgi:hypothetical protein